MNKKYKFSFNKQQQSEISTFRLSKQSNTGRTSSLDIPHYDLTSRSRQSIPQPQKEE